MSSSNTNDILAKCQHLLAYYASVLARHQYLSEQLTSIQKKGLSSSSSNREILEKEEQLLEAIEEKLKALQDDSWLDKLLSVAKNKPQAEEIERLHQNWGVGKPEQPFDNPAHCIIWHADKHGGGEILRYLRKANQFSKRGAKMKLVYGAKRWRRKNGEFLIERDGKIVSYGKTRRG